MHFQMELGNAMNVLNQPKAPTPSIMDLGKQLLESAKEGQKDKVNDLVCRGAPFTTDWLGKSALHMAAENNHLETCKTLLKAGISKDSRTKVERTPLHLAICNGHEKIVELLLKEKCDVNARDMMKMTPLHWAVENDHPNLVKLLLRYRANPHAESKHGDTPISIALELGFEDIFEMLNLNDAGMFSVSAEEQQEATDSLLIEMEKDNIEMKSEACDDDDISFSPDMSNSSQSPSALHMLQEEAPDDANKFLQTVMSCGRQIVVTDIGKEIMKTQDFNMNTNNSNQFAQLAALPRKNGDIKQKTVGVVMTNPSQKILTTKSKTLTSEEINKLYSEGKIIRTVSSPNVVTNGTIRLGKYRVQPKIINNDSTGNIGPIKVSNQSNIPTSTVGSINSGTTIATKKIVVKTDPPQLTNMNATKLNKTIHVLPSNDKNMVQMRHNDFQLMLQKIENMQRRITALERHCGIDGSTFTASDINQMQ